MSSKKQKVSRVYGKGKLVQLYYSYRKSLDTLRKASDMRKTLIEAGYEEKNVFELFQPLGITFAASEKKLKAALKNMTLQAFFSGDTDYQKKCDRRS